MLDPVAPARTGHGGSTYSVAGGAESRGAAREAEPYRTRKSQSPRRARGWPAGANGAIFPPPSGRSRPGRAFPNPKRSMPDKLGREVIVVGDKVLIKPEDEESKTPSGLYLPQGVAAKEAVAGGYVVNVGPGYPTVEPAVDGEPWSGGEQRPEMRYVPLQAGKGDFAIFLRRDSVEVKIDGNDYLIVGHSSILLLIRDRGLLP